MTLEKVRKKPKLLLTAWKKLFSSQLFVFFTLGILAVLLNFDYLKTLLEQTIAPGFDGAFHVATSTYYADHIFPKTWGWMPEWYAGFPFPQFYTPLFFIVSALLFKTLPFWSELKITLVLLVVLSCTIPYLLSRISFSLSKTKSVIGQWTTGILAILGLSTFYFINGNNGITLQSTFNIGLVTQVFGFYFLLLWLLAFINSRKFAVAKYLSVLFLAGIILSSTHVTIVALVIFISFAFVEVVLTYKRHDRAALKTLLLHYLFQGSIPILLSLFWYLPLATHWHYLTGMSLDRVSQFGFYTARYAPHLIVIALSICVFYKQKAGRALSLSLGLALLFLLLTLPLTDLLGGKLPLHPTRYVSSFSFLALIPAGLLLEYLFAKSTFILVRISIIVFFGIAFSFTYIQSISVYKYEAFLPVQTNKIVQEIAEYFKNKPELVSVESTSREGTIEARAIYAAIGLAGGNSAFSIYTEPSISSIFFPGIQNGFSFYRTLLSVHSLLTTNATYLGKPIDERIDRAKYAGIKYLLVKSNGLVTRLEKNPRVSLENQFGLWKLFTIKEDVPHFIIPTKEPVLAFTDLEFKRREENPYEFVRLQEEIFRSNKMGLVMVHSSNPNIDEFKELARFKTIFIGTYKYKNEMNVYNSIVSLASTTNLFLLESVDPLFSRLSTLKNLRVHIVQKTKGSYFSKTTEKDLALFISDLASHSASTSHSTSVPSVTRTQSCVEVKGINDRVPLLIKSSYFPGFISSNKTPIYLGTPSFIFGFFNRNTNICLEAGKSEFTGIVISGFTLLFILYAATTEAVRYRKYSL